MTATQIQTKARIDTVIDLSTIFAGWYILSAVLLNFTSIEHTLTGVPYYIFALCTHLLIPLEIFFSISTTHIPIVAAIAATVVLSQMKEMYTKREKLMYALPPILAGGYNALAVLSIFIFHTAAFGMSINLLFYGAWFVCCILLQTSN